MPRFRTFPVASEGRDADLLYRARRVAERGDDLMWVWSTGERLAVALILDRRDLLDEMGWTFEEAVGRWAGECWGSDRSRAVAWLAGMRAELWAEAACSEIGWPVADGVRP